MPLPKYLDKFSDEDVNRLLEVGFVSSSFDDFGNIAIDKDEASITASVITFPMTLDVYDDQKVLENFDIAFEEFVAVPITNVELEASASLLADGELTADTSEVDATTAALESEIANLESELESAQGDQVLIGASRDEIIRLRIALGEGTTSNDFSDTFPYLPLNDPENNV
ncbi:MAG: hypothetical protein ACXACA_06315 [Candidatus Ranarchaeia archaeon]|jgi:hypothetical protein